MQYYKTYNRANRGGRGLISIRTSGRSSQSIARIDEPRRASARSGRMQNSRNTAGRFACTESKIDTLNYLVYIKDYSEANLDDQNSV